MPIPRSRNEDLRNPVMWDDMTRAVVGSQDALDTALGCSLFKKRRLRCVHRNRRTGRGQQWGEDDISTRRAVAARGCGRLDVVSDESWERDIRDVLDISTNGSSGFDGFESVGDDSTIATVPFSVLYKEGKNEKYTPKITKIDSHTSELLQESDGVMEWWDTSNWRKVTTKYDGEGNNVRRGTGEIPG
jgi:hypothetical protein